jgi:hypothetical protein
MHGNHGLGTVLLCLHGCLCLFLRLWVAGDFVDVMVRPCGRVQKLRLDVFLGLVARKLRRVLGSGWLSRMLLGPSE